MFISSKTFFWLILMTLCFEIVIRLLIVLRKNSYKLPDQPSFYIANTSKELFAKMVYDDYITDFNERETFFLNLQDAHNEIGNKIAEGKEFRSRFINFRNGERDTMPEPVTVENDFLVFGGSTVLCLEVPDDLTLPSQIQRRFVQLGIKTRVHNYGRGGKKIGKVETLIDGAVKKHPRTTKIVLYFGYNDVGWLGGQNPRNFVSACIDRIFGFLSALYIARLIDLLVKVIRVRNSAKRYARSNLEFFKYLKEKYAKNGIDVYFFLQPLILTKEKLSLLEKSWLISDPLFLTGIRAGYTTYLSEGRDIVVSMIGILDSFENTLFVDNCHLGPLGNHFVARGIVDLVTNMQKEFGKQSIFSRNIPRINCLAAIRRTSGKLVDENPYMYPLF